MTQTYPSLSFPTGAGKLRLITPTRRFGLEFLAFAYECIRSGDRAFFFQPLFNMEDYIKKAHQHAQGRNLPSGFVPSSEYWLLDPERQVVGKSSLRHKLNDPLFRWGGHIGYCVRPSCRNRGYGTRILHLTLHRARQYGLEKVLLTCDEDNHPSARVIEKNDGQYENSLYCPDIGKTKRRYWIDVNRALPSCEQSLP